MKKNNQPQTLEDAFIMEVDEELKNERIRALWNKYGFYLIVFVAIVLTATVSFETIKNWYNKKYQEQSNSYAIALALQSQDKNKESLQVLQEIEKFGTIYAQLAKLQQANILFEQGKNDEALEVLDQFIKAPKADKSLRQVALLKSISFKLGKEDYKKIEEQLTPLIQENGNWSALAQEMLAMAALADKNEVKAKEIYQNIVGSENIPEDLRLRAQDMLLILDKAHK